MRPATVGRRRVPVDRTGSTAGRRPGQPYADRMGMHHGFIVARSDWPSLHAALEARCGELDDREEIPPHRWFDLPPGEDVFHVATEDGTTYLLDPSMVLSTDPDLVAGLAAELSCLVVGGGAETVSGTFWLNAADGPDVLRLYFHVLATMTEPFELGDPMPSEATVDWTDVDGDGVLARVRDLGLGTGVLEHGPAVPGRGVAWVGVEPVVPGPLGAQVEQHCARHRVDGPAAGANGDTGRDGAAAPPDPPRPSRRRGLFRRGR